MRARVFLGEFGDDRPPKALKEPTPTATATFLEKVRWLETNLPQLALMLEQWIDRYFAQRNA
jgi:hypothetical protein